MGEKKGGIRLLRCRGATLARKKKGFGQTHTMRILSNGKRRGIHLNAGEEKKKGPFPGERGERKDRSSNPGGETLGVRHRRRKMGGGLFP